MRLALSDITVKTLKFTGKQEFYRDTKFPAFGIRVSKRTKTFFVIKERKYHSLGHYPALSLSKAREKALQLDTSRPALSYTEATELYLQTYVRPNYRPRSASEVERLLKKLPDRPLKDITTGHITTVLDTLTPSEANHLFGVLRTFFNWCFRRDLIKFSPPTAKLTKPHKEQSRSRVLTPDEIRRVWTSLGDDTFSVIIKLCLLTGQRKGEIAAIKSEWLNKTAASLTFPSSITKNKREHSIPLTSLTSKTLSIFLTHTVSTNSPIVYTAWSKPKADLDKRSGVSNWCIHDLRRTCSTNLAELEAPPHIIDKILNHSTNSLHARYNRYRYMEEMRQALTAWEKRLEALLAS